jgi:hypothetical protein
MAKHDNSVFALSDLRHLPKEERAHIELLTKLHLAIRHRREPPSPEEASFWEKGILITDHPDGTSSVSPIWTSKIEYEAWHRARFPGCFPVS